MRKLKEAAGSFQPAASLLFRPLASAVLGVHRDAHEHDRDNARQKDDRILARLERRPVLAGRGHDIRHKVSFADGGRPQTGANPAQWFLELMAGKANAALPREEGGGPTLPPGLPDGRDSNASTELSFTAKR
jgi:hypothetical protein